MQTILAKTSFNIQISKLNKSYSLDLNLLLPRHLVSNVFLHAGFGLLHPAKTDSRFSSCRHIAQPLVDNTITLKPRWGIA